MNNFREEIELLFQLDPPENIRDIRDILFKLLSPKDAMNTVRGFTMAVDNDVANQFVDPLHFKYFKIEKAYNGVIKVTENKKEEFSWFKTYDKVMKDQWGYRISEQQTKLKDYIDGWIIKATYNDEFNDER